MALILSRDKALTISQVSTYGTASFLSLDGQEVKVPLALVLGASTLVRSMMAELHLHPGIHGPLVLSFEVAADVLGSVADMLGVGEANVKEENIEEIIQVLNSLGVEANLSQIGKNIVYEHTVANDEEVKLEVLGTGSDEESDSCENSNNAKDILLGMESKLSQLVENIAHENIASCDEEVRLENVFEPVSDQETELSDADVCEARDNSLIENNVNVEKIGERSEQCYPTDENVSDKTGKKCNVCNHSANSAANLKIHMRKHSGEKPYKCPLCDYSCSFSSVLIKHSRTHTGEKPFKCPICKYCCSTSSDLKRHNRIHTGEKPFKCKMCNYSSSNSGDLKIHNRIHTRDKPFKCKICNYSCSKSGDLKKHNRIHTRDKPFQCKICNYSCSNSSHLKRHNRIHTRDKPFKCKICDFSCSQSSSLRRHNRIHTGENPYKCKICNKTFSDSRYLREHGKIHTGEQNHGV